MQEIFSITGLSEKQIKRWLENKRSKLETKPYKCFTPDEKKILLEFFQNQNNHPGPADLFYLSSII
jgi:hypothetical protein